MLLTKQTKIDHRYSSYLRQSKYKILVTPCIAEPHCNVFWATLQAFWNTLLSDMENNCERKVNKNCKVFVAVVLNKFIKKITTLNLFIWTFKKFYFVKKGLRF